MNKVKKFLIGGGIIGALTGVIVAVVKAAAPAEAAGLITFQSSGVTNPNAVGSAPDGKFALISGAEGSFLTLQIAGEPISVASIKIHLVNPYDYGVSNLLSVQVSPDGVEWTTVAPGLGDLGGGTDVKTVYIGRLIKYVKLIQKLSGVEMGVDAVEVIT